MGNKRTNRDLEVRLEQINRRLVVCKYLYSRCGSIYYIYAKDAKDSSNGIGSQVFCGTLGESIAFCDGIRDVLIRF